MVNDHHKKFRKFLKAPSNLKSEFILGEFLIILHNFEWKGKADVGKTRPCVCSVSLSVCPSWHV